MSFAVSVCGNCGVATFPPRLLCRNCGASDFNQEDVGDGVLVSRVDRGDGRLATVRVLDGLTILARLEADATVGSRVALTRDGNTPVARSLPVG